MQKGLLTIEELNRIKPERSLLTALHFIESRKLKSGKCKRMILALCKCGGTKEVTAKYFANGDCISCGCSNKGDKRYIKKPKRIKGRLYHSWLNMIGRCYNPKTQRYKSYGGKGVTVCDEWQGKNGYTNFKKWAIGAGWKAGLQIDKDKIGSGLLYSPNTCCWLTKKENQDLAAPRYEFEGKMMKMKEISELLGVSITQLHNYRYKGLTFDDIKIKSLNKPIKNNNNMDNLMQQIVNITKAGAYDAIAPHLAEVKEQNANFRAALNAVLDEITKATPSEIIDTPATVLNRIAEHCLNALRNNRPL